MSRTVVPMLAPPIFLQSVVNRLNKINDRIQWIVLNEYSKSDWELLKPEIHNLLLDLKEFDGNERTKRAIADSHVKIRLDPNRDTQCTTLIVWVERFRELAFAVHSKQWERGPTAFMYDHERREWSFLLPMLSDILTMAVWLAGKGEMPHRSINSARLTVVTEVLGALKLEGLDASAHGVMRVLYSDIPPSLAEAVRLMLPRDYDIPPTQLQIDRIMEALHGME